MSFQDILGNSRVKKILRKCLQRERMPNSLLFTGPSGVGKMDMAFVLAKALNCLKKKDDSCDECRNCMAISKGNFPDVLAISPEKEIIKIDQMRFLKETAYLKPMTGKKRVFIVERAEKMKEEASNSLLKILEEPPLYSHIVMTTSNPSLIIETIQSRCQIIQFSPVLREDIERILLENGRDAEKARIISLFVHGNLKQALSLEWEDVQAKRNQAWLLFEALLRKQGTAEFFDILLSLRPKIREELVEVMEIMITLFRDLLLIKDKGDMRLLLNPDYKEKIETVEQLLSLKQTFELLQFMEFALYAVSKKLNTQLLISMMFSQFMERKNV
jgi:DNA polymerase III delta' subunit